MGHYNTVKQGDPFHPSAKLENEVRRFFNGGATISGGKSKAGSTNNIRISAMNETDTAIPSGAAVAIYHNDEKDYFYIELATAADDFWGITVGIIPPDSSGTVVVSGIVNALISPGDGDFVVPVNGLLMRSTSGNARVLYGGDGIDKLGMILLGGTSGSGYAGPFAIHVTSLTRTGADMTLPKSSWMNITRKMKKCTVHIIVTQAMKLSTNVIADSRELQADVSSVCVTVTNAIAKWTKKKSVQCWRTLTAENG